MKALRKQIFGVVEWAQGVLNRSSEVLTQIPSGKWSYIMLAYDEEDAVTTDSNDIDILIAVDSIQSDEQLLSIMWDALQETQLDPADSVKFVLKIINHRVQHNNLTTTPSQAFLDLKRLPKQTVTSVMLMVSNILRNEINRQSPTNISKVIDWTPWMEDCVFILLSETTSPLPGGVNQMFSLLLADQLRFQLLFDMIKSRVPDPDTFPHVLERLRGALLLLKGDDMLLALRSLVVKYFCHEHNVVHSRLIDVVHEHPEIPSNHLQHLVDLLIYTLTNEMKPDMYWYSYLVDELHLIFALSSNASWRDTVIKLVQTILIQPRNTAIYCRYPMGLDEQNSKLKEEAQELFIDAILAANDADRRTILWNVEQALAWQWRTRSEADDNNWDRFTRIDPLEVVNVLLRLIRKMKEQEVSIVDFAWYFLQSWWDVNEGLRTVAGRHYERHPAIAKECLEFINSLDLSAPPLSDGQDQEDGFANWAHSFPMPESMYPDTLIESLAQFLPVEETTFSHRVRRLRLLQNKDDEQTRDPDWPPNIAGPLTKSFGARERPPSRTRRNRSRRRRRSRSSVQTEQLDIQNVPNADSDSDWATDESNMDGKGDGQGSDTGSKDRASSRERVTVTVNAAESSSDHGDDDDNECQPSPTDTADPDHEVATPVTSEPPCVPAGPATRRG
ncbi:hypothetical protein BC835DRAFT_310538 [Cytidiella melzeri]|nr:hypothetical protein BC835DRAFT_310538 [Cytidiella melzeri]